MILIINTTPGDHLEIVLAAKRDDFIIKKISGRFHQAEKLLPAIDDLLKKRKVKLKNLRAVGVVSGPGGFTAVRIGVAVANALGYGLKIKVVGIKSGEFSSSEELTEKVFARAKAIKGFRPVMPYYDRAPNITPSKKR